MFGLVNDKITMQGLPVLLLNICSETFCFCVNRLKRTAVSCVIALLVLQEIIYYRNTVSKTLGMGPCNTASITINRIIMTLQNTGTLATEQSAL